MALPEIHAETAQHRFAAELESDVPQFKHAHCVAFQKGHAAAAATRPSFASDSPDILRAAFGRQHPRPAMLGSR